MTDQLRRAVAELPLPPSPYVGTVTVGMQKYVSALTKIKPARFANLNLTACLFSFWFRYMQNSII